mgnify:FL=1
MFCKNRGKEIEGGAKFRPNCGRSLSEKTESAKPDSGTKIQDETGKKDEIGQKAKAFFVRKSVLAAIAAIVAVAVSGVFLSCSTKTYEISGTWTAVKGSKSGQQITFDESTARVWLNTGIDRRDGVFRTLEASILTLSFGEGTSEITVEYNKKKAYITLPSGETVSFEGDIQKEGAPVNGTLRQIDNPQNIFSFNKADNTFSFSIDDTELSGSYTERNAVVAYCRFTTLHIGTIDQPCDETISILIDKTDTNTFRSATGVWKR